MFGPTLLDLGDSIGVGVAVMSAMFGARASGGAVGSIVLGYLMDKWSKFSYSIITLVLASCIISESTEHAYTMFPWKQAFCTYVHNM